MKWDDGFLSILSPKISNSVAVKAQRSGSRLPPGLQLNCYFTCSFGPGSSKSKRKRNVLCHRIEPPYSFLPHSHSIRHFVMMAFNICKIKIRFLKYSENQ